MQLDRIIPRSRSAPRHPAWALLAAGVALALCTLFAPASAAESGTGSGTITGRVQNLGNGNYLNNARISVPGTNIVTFTNSFGEYTITNAPAGEVTLRVFYTGLDPRDVTVTVPSGGQVVQNVGLTNVARYGQQETETVTLDEFVVNSTRETNAAAIAQNEQRFSPNIKNVVASDAFGDVTEGNVGEFLKYLPGVTVEYVAADVRTISVRGFADNFTSVNVDGNRMASAASGNAIRSFELEQVSINNVSRVEVVKVPTPDMPADSLGGSVNLVSRSAFEHDRPSFNFSAYVSMNDEDTRLFSKTPGPDNGKTYKVLPGFQFNYINPINDRFGIVFNGLSSNQFNEQHRSQPSWRFSDSVLPVNVKNPYLRSYQMQDGPKNSFRDSISAKLDFKPADDQVISFSYQYNYYKSFFGNRNVNWDVGGPNASADPGEEMTWGPTFTHGQVGRGDVRMGGSFRDKLGATNATMLDWRWDPGLWEIDAGLNYSRSRSWYRDISRGHFDQFDLRMVGDSQVRFDNITYPRPQQITVLDADGNEVDAFDLSNYRINEVRSRPVDGSDEFAGAKLNVKRRFELSFPFAVKAGASIRRQLRDSRRLDERWNFIGTDGETLSDDDSAAPFLDTTYINQDPTWGFASTPQWLDPFKLYQFFTEHPEQFRYNEETSTGNRVNNSLRMTEWVTAAYVQAEMKFMENRLSILTGLRYEKTEDFGQGPLIDDQLGLEVERGFSAEGSYSGTYPSLHITYNLTDNFLVRLAYAKTLGRPDFGNIIPRVEIEDVDPGELGDIEIANPDLKPWTGDNYDLSLEYYSPQGGVVSAGVFRKDLSDFFVDLPVTATPENLAALGLSNEYVDWTIHRTRNGGDAQIEGVEFNVQQPLDFLGEWGRSFIVSANATKLDLSGERGADFRKFIDESGSVGITFSRRPFIVMLKYNYRGREFNSPQSESNYGPDANEYYDSRFNLDLNLEYQISQHFTLFANARNITNEDQVLQRYSPLAPEYAWQYRAENFGVQYALGVKGRF